MNEDPKPLEPIAAPPQGRPRGTKITEATRKNITMRDLVMKQALSSIDLKIAEWNTPEAREEPVLPAEVLKFVTGWFKTYWIPMDKRRLAEEFVTHVDAILEKSEVLLP